MVIECPRIWYRYFALFVELNSWCLPGEVISKVENLVFYKHETAVPCLVSSAELSDDFQNTAGCVEVQENVQQRSMT